MKRIFQKAAQTPRKKEKLQSLVPDTEPQYMGLDDRGENAVPVLSVKWPPKKPE